MRVALVQMHVLRDDPAWNVDGLRKLLKTAAEGVDLVVFPESMPFYEFPSKRHQPKTLKKAKSLLEESSADMGNTAFIAGGYVADHGKVVNAVFLVHRGQIKGQYLKRILWQEEKRRVAVGAKGERFKWGRFSCVPLICADACQNPSPTSTEMMYEAIKAGVGPQSPIVVSTYGADLQSPYWQEPLRLWAKGCGCPVLVCAIAGKGKAFEEHGIDKHYGGGGSGVFWPDWEKSEQWTERGIYIVDLKTREIEKRDIET